MPVMLQAGGAEPAYGVDLPGGCSSGNNRALRLEAGNRPVVMEPSRPVILVFTGFYLPGYKSGGPVRTISNMAELMSDEFAFRIVTRDRDALDASPYPGVDPDHWVDVGSAEVYYASPCPRALKKMLRVMRETEYDVLYLNSFFDPRFTVIPLILRLLRLVPRKPLVVAPRGEFSTGAISLKSTKKRLFMLMANIAGLYSGALWQASSSFEAEDIRREMGASEESVLVAPDLPGMHSHHVLSPRTRSSGDPLKIVFLSRISPKKNLDYALRVLRQVSNPVEFSVFGSVFDQSYWDACQRLADELPSNVSFRYHGSVPHEDVVSTLSGYDLFFFPTRGENFGHVIHEALYAGLPVLLSDQTPWRDLVSDGVGWDLPLSDPSEFVRVIEQTGRLTSEQRQILAKRAYGYAQDVAVNGSTVQQNRALFRSSLNQTRAHS